MVNSSVCSSFANVPPNGYRPFGCKPLTVNTPFIKGTGAENRRRFFFTTKGNTIRENATLDLIQTVPNFVDRAIDLRYFSSDELRITQDGALRVTQDDALRILL